MTDRLEKLESELAAMRPCALPKGLENRIAKVIGSKPQERRADWPLRSAMVAGAMAACTIVSVLLWGGATGGSMPPPMNVAQDVHSFGSYPLVMARADWAADDLK
jgi:hypothetical protein